MKKILLTLALLDLFNVVKAQVPSYVPTTNLVAWIPFDGDIKDYSGNANHGVGTGYAYTTDRKGLSNKACNFPGGTSYVQLKKLPVNTGSTYSINFWLNVNKFYNAGSGGYVISDIHPGISCSPYPQITMYSDSINMTECNTWGYNKAYGYKTDFINVWRMITQIFTADTTFLYVDTKLVKKYAHIWGSSTDMNVTIANCDNSTNNFNYGSDVIFDDLGVWDRRLTECEILNLYNSAALGFSAQPTNKTGLIGGSVSFTCTATVPSATYQWQSNIGTAGAYVNLSNTGQYSGVSTNTLNVSSLTTANNLQKFRCIINNLNSTCSKTSDSASITITNLAIKDVSGVNYSLEQNVPNPSNGNTLIQYTIGNFTKNAELSIYDMTGRKIMNQQITKSGGGSMLIQKDELNSGLYFYSLFVDGIKFDTKKMIIN